jgi:zinc/manganese transport system permease protein
MSEMYAQVGILVPALVAGLVVLLSHVPLGQQVLRRGIVFIDLAIAQVAGLGVIAAQAAGFDLHGWTTQVAAVVAALLAALLLTWTERKRPEVQEALIGVLFVLASTAQILLLANDPHGGEALKDLLAGQILWVSNEQLARAAALTAAFLAAWFRFRARLGTVGFYVVFSVMVTTSVQLVGVYLVFTTLIVPALAVYRHAQDRQLLLGYALALGSYVVGLAVSLCSDLPSSAVIVWAMALLGFAAHLTARANGNAASREAA